MYVCMCVCMYKYRNICAQTYAVDSGAEEIQDDDFQIEQFPLYNIVYI